MQQNNIKNLIRVSVLLLFWTGQSNAQIGLGVENPTNPVEIKTDAGKVIVDPTGKLGVLVANPKVAIDLRSGNNGAVAVGNTDKTAVQAGAGALRYVASPAIGVKGYLEFSDGTNWVSFFPKGKPRIIVMASKTTQDTYVFESGTPSEIGPKSGIMQRRSSYLTNWAEKLDSDSGVPTNNFNPATGEFIAPRTGVYFATFTFALQSSQVNTGGNNQTEAIWEVRNPAGNITQRVKTNNGYASDTGASPNAVPVGSACTVSVYLNKGDKLRPFTWITVAFDGTISQFDISGSGVYNSLTIVEQ
ncbi:complement C1q domain-containing protein [Chryseobacterium phosphatilyticum]|nr:complement C1q domain-containing protein [Chryseobacterium phosphatilyticum]